MEKQLSNSNPTINYTIRVTCLVVLVLFLEIFLGCFMYSVLKSDFHQAFVKEVTSGVCKEEIRQILKEPKFADYHGGTARNKKKFERYVKHFNPNLGRGGRHGGGSGAWWIDVTRIPLRTIQEFCKASVKYCPKVISPRRRRRQLQYSLGEHIQAVISNSKNSHNTQGLPGLPGLPGLKGKQGNPGPKGETGNKGGVGHPGPPATNGTPGRDGIPGVQGKEGPVGPPGPRGYPGVPGPQGEKGNEGKQGLDGLSGIPGDKGEKGIRGPPGIPGHLGHKGNMGDLGVPGLDGIPGKKGSAGESGRPGIPGYPGQKGDKGEMGLLGIGGTPGEKGDVGKEGLPGFPGIPGGKGGKGDAGYPGLNGISGSKGDKGERGIRGIPGPTGFKRPYSVCGSEIPAETSNTTISTPQCSGGHGETGTAGTEDSPGKDGLPGPRGEVGPVGPPGPPGHPGLRGVQGEKGDKGEHGPYGIPVPGIPGIKGDKGNAGVPGVDGKKGDRAEIGPQGSHANKDNAEKGGSPGTPGQKGDKGDAGHPGLHGIPGSKGDKGEPGIPSETEIPVEIATPKPQGCSDRHRFSWKASKYQNQEYLGLPTRTAECILRTVGEPKVHGFFNEFYGSWMVDSYPPTEFDAEKSWVTTDEDNVLFEYDDLSSFVLNKSYPLHESFRGNAHVIYKGSFFYQPTRGNPRIIKYPLNNQPSQILKVPGLTSANSKLLYTTNYNYLDFSVDENGLWVIFGVPYTHNTAVMKVDADTMKPQYIWNITVDHLMFNEMFVVSGILYGIDNVTEDKIRISFVMDLYTEKLSGVDIDVIKQFGLTTMATYDHRKKQLMALDNGWLLSYPVTCETLEPKNKEVPTE